VKNCDVRWLVDSVSGSFFSKTGPGFVFHRSVTPWERQSYNWDCRLLAALTAKDGAHSRPKPVSGFLTDSEQGARATDIFKKDIGLIFFFPTWAWD
jgi:hypothetical protein